MLHRLDVVTKKCQRVLQGCSDELITAALLHDLGHLLHDLGDTPTLRGVDDGHQVRARAFVRVCSSCTCSCVCRCCECKSLLMFHSLVV